MRHVTIWLRRVMVIEVQLRKEQVQRAVKLGPSRKLNFRLVCSHNAASLLCTKLKGTQRLFFCLN